MPFKKNINFYWFQYYLWTKYSVTQDKAVFILKQTPSGFLKRLPPIPLAHSSTEGIPSNKVYKSQLCKSHNSRDHSHLPILVSSVAYYNLWVLKKCDNCINEPIWICKYFVSLEGSVEQWTEPGLFADWPRFEALRCALPWGRGKDAHPWLREFSVLRVLLPVSWGCYQVGGDSAQSPSHNVWHIVRCQEQVAILLLLSMGYKVIEAQAIHNKSLIEAILTPLSSFWE